MFKSAPEKSGSVSFETIKSDKYHCPCCNSRATDVFYTIENIPVHSCLLMSNRKDALGYPRGDLRMGFCRGCGFIYNTAFDPGVHDYCDRYEETQEFSACFNTFAKSLAQKLIDQYDLRDKKILEIGCGKGQFLTLLCQLGHNQGTGIDPSYIPERRVSDTNKRIKFIKDFYSEKYCDIEADFICCRHTLEHIGPTGKFLQMLRKAVGDRKDTVIFFEVPDILRVLREGAFWDIYYEHCSYFSLGSLSRLFEAAGFEIVQLELDYDDQYILLAARPIEKTGNTIAKSADDLDGPAKAVNSFAEICSYQIKNWQNCIEDIISRGRRIVLWGSGSKAVGFLTTIGLSNQIEYVVDINPHKHGKFLPGCGRQIVSPEFLTDYMPDYVIAMNPIYCAEIQNDLDRLGVKAELLAV